MHPSPRSSRSRAARSACTSRPRHRSRPTWWPSPSARSKRPRAVRVVPDDRDPRVARARKGRTSRDFALEAAARACLERLEAYFDLPYPYEKLDLVAVPDFEFGAMENAGAVFFRETLLLVDPATITLQEKKRVAEVICHELAHMWYGDLVTMAWWDDLWLNEAFATWMAFHIVDAWKPEWQMWHDFQHYRRRRTASTHWTGDAPDLHDGAHAGRSDRELRPDHLREGRLGRAHDRALPRRPTRSATACARTSAEHAESQHGRRGPVERARRSLRPGRRTGRARVDRTTRLPAR